MSGSKTRYNPVDLTAVSQMINNKWVKGQVEIAKGLPKDSLVKATFPDALKFGGRNPILLIELDSLPFYRMKPLNYLRMMHK